MPQSPLDYLRGALPPPPAAPKKNLPESLNGPLNLPAHPPVRVNDPSGKLTGSYDGGLLRNIAQQAKLEGVDPLTALALSGQESTFGRYDKDNPLQLSPSSGISTGGLEPMAAQSQLIQRSLNYFKNRTNRQRSQTPHDEELILQSYNGLGKVPKGHYAEGSNMTGAQDKPYGKAVMGIRDLLKSSPDILNLIKGK